MLGLFDHTGSFAINVLFPYEVILHFMSHPLSHCLSQWCTDQSIVLCVWMPRYCLCCPEGVLDICYCSQMWHSILAYLVFVL